MARSFTEEELAALIAQAAEQGAKKALAEERARQPAPAAAQTDAKLLNSLVRLQEEHYKETKEDREERKEKERREGMTRNGSGKPFATRALAMQAAQSRVRVEVQRVGKRKLDKISEEEQGDKTELALKLFEGTARLDELQLKLVLALDAETKTPGAAEAEMKEAAVRLIKKLGLHLEDPRLLDRVEYTYNNMEVQPPPAKVQRTDMRSYASSSSSSSSVGATGGRGGLRNGGEGGAVFRPLSQEEKDALSAAQRCWKCYEKGHMASDRKIGWRCAKERPAELPAEVQQAIQKAKENQTA